MKVQSLLILSLNSLPAECSRALNTDPESWGDYLQAQLSWAHQQPWTFLIVILLLLFPFFGYSAVLSLRLNQQIQDIYDNKVQTAGKKTS